MARGRESRSAAAARAQPLSTLALALALLSTMPRGAFSQGLALPPPHHNMTCDGVPYPFGDGVPYPFGVRGASLGGFEVTCGPNKEAMLFIDGHRYQINVVSLLESYVVIFAGPMKQVCYDRNGKPTPATETGAMKLEGTPFTFSKRNKLVGIGCNYRLLVSFTKPSGDFDPWPYASFSASCNSSSDSISGSCSGEAFCEMPIPDQVNATKSFTLSFERTTANATGEEDGTCSAAFFLDKDEQVFTSKDADQGARPLRKALLPTGERRMILDWAIGSSTCYQVQGYNLEPLCKDMGVCIDSPRGAGYLCRCPEGYEGNPYVSGGCEDINECRDPSGNNCTFTNFCHNTPGSYTCSCPENKTGDGYRIGTGCNDVLLPFGLPPAQLQGLSVCNKGDGRKTGSGCQKIFPLDTVLGVGLALAVTITSAVLCWCWAMKKREVERKRSELFRKNGGLLLQQKFSAITCQEEGLSAKIFSAEELKIATDNYSETRILGRGGHGTVYKGILSDKTVVAIKKSKVFDESQVEQFINEIAILSQIDHPNVVRLLGCCLETQVPLLVYEFVPNGTLFHHIHNRNVPCSLTWEDSLRIVTEIAEALAHLHSTSSVPIIHRDIKSSNILLDENLVAKIADFVHQEQSHLIELT